MKEQVESVE